MPPRLRNHYPCHALVLFFILLLSPSSLPNVAATKSLIPRAPAPILVDIPDITTFQFSRRLFNTGGLSYSIYWEVLDEGTTLHAVMSLQGLPYPDPFVQRAWMALGFRSDSMLNAHFVVCRQGEGEEPIIEERITRQKYAPPVSNNVIRKAAGRKRVLTNINALSQIGATRINHSQSNTRHIPKSLPAVRVHSKHNSETHRGKEQPPLGFQQRFSQWMHRR